MIKYKLTTITPPTNGEIIETALSVPEGKTYSLKAMGMLGQTSDNVDIVINSTNIVEVLNNISFGWGYTIPLDTDIKGPQNVDIRITDKTGTGDTVPIVLAYEEK